MKILTGDKILDAILAKKMNCNFREINEYADEYRLTHPNVYLEISKVDIQYAVSIYPDKFYLKNGIIFKQEIILCPTCKKNHWKYPDEKLFEKIKQNIKEVIKIIKNK